MKETQNELIHYKSFTTLAIQFPTGKNTPKPALRYLLQKNEVKELLDRYWPQCDTKDLSVARYKRKTMGDPVSDRDYFALKLREWDFDNEKVLAPFDHISHHSMANHIRSLLKMLEEVELARNGALVGTASLEVATA
jgi:hypothetical protein